jgi:hypothetical protein
MQFQMLGTGPNWEIGQEKIKLGLDRSKFSKYILVAKRKF